MFMKNIFKLLLLSLVFVACDDVEDTIYNSDGAQSDTFLSFSRTVYTLPIERDGVGEVALVLNSSTVETFDRTYNITLDTTLTTADPLTYTLPSTITIPAGSYQGTAIITGVDDNLVEATPRPVVITLTGLTDEFVDIATATINVREVCSVTAPFVGSYVVSQITEPIPVNDGLPVFTEGSVVEITIPADGSAFDRTFAADVYPAIGPGSTFNFNFILSCGNTNLTNFIDYGNGCSDVTLTFDAAAEGSESTYDPEDDSVFELTFTEDSSNSCNSTTQTTIRFTKVQ